MKRNQKGDGWQGCGTVARMEMGSIENYFDKGGMMACLLTGMVLMRRIKDGGETGFTAG